MLIDKIRRRAKAGGGYDAYKRVGETSSFKQTSSDDFVKLLNTATSYEIGGLVAFLEHLENTNPEGAQNLLDNARTARSDHDLFAMYPVWTEAAGEGYGFLTYLDAGTIITDLVSCGEDDEDDIEDDTIRRRTDKAYEFLYLIHYLKQRPKELHLMHLETMQSPREARFRGGKEIKSPLCLVQTVVIDGVKRIYSNPITYEVHKRGWHIKLHDVIGHWRHLKNAQTMCTCHKPPQAATWISPFQRGNPDLVTSRERRYKVIPDPIFEDVKK